MMHQIVRTGCVESLALEDVAQMASTRSASDLGALHPIRPIYVTTNSTGNGWVCTKGIPGISQYGCGAMHSPRKVLTVEERRPSAAALELCGALVQRGAAACTFVDTFLVVLVVLSGAGRLCAFLAKDAELCNRY